jgi:hypothetical protein
MIAPGCSHGMESPETAAGSDARRGRARSPFGDYLPAASLLLAGLIALAAASILSGPPSGQYLVVAPPGASLAQSLDLVRKGGGSLAATSPLANVLVAGASRGGFAGTLRKAGAWLILPLPRVAGCGEPSSQEQTP